MAKKYSPPDLTGLPHEQKDILFLTLLTRLEVLESKVNKNSSSNSSKPPSSDGLAKKTGLLRQSSGKPSGARAGHKGSTLKQTLQPAERIDHPLPGHCDHCHQELSLHDALIGERRKVFDVPVAAFDVVEHPTMSVRCHCGQLHTSAFPARVTEPVLYSPNVRALAVHLTQDQILLYARAAELIRDVYGLAISPGTLEVRGRTEHCKARPI